jgi:signal transduction histidine kinase
MKRLTQHSSRLLFALSLLWVSALLLIGTWWVYFMLNFENFFLNTERTKITTMLAWEGGSFIILLLLLSFSLLILYLKDTKKNKSLQAFFASLTHELKTPLASIKLQSEVINEILEQKKDPTLSKLFGRLINDTVKLEIQMDKILQLSRIERGGKLNTTRVALIPLIRKLAMPWESQFNVHIETNNKDDLFPIEADEFALELIIKNLFEIPKIIQMKKMLPSR